MSGRTEDGGREGGCGDCELLLHSQGTSRGKLLGPGTSEEDEGRRVGHVRMDRRREERGNGRVCGGGEEGYGTKFNSAEG